MTRERTYDFRKYEDCAAWVRDFGRRFPTTPRTFNGYSANVKFAPRLTGEDPKGLPPGAAAPMYAVAEFAGCPQGWGKGPNDVFIPVPWDADGKGPGMWYDNTRNQVGTYDVAVVYSTTGMNPITGRKADVLRLERYEERCPAHDVPFVADRFCEACDFRWPPQNYVAAPNTLWWDGFRRPDGKVRQFFFSADELRDVGIAVLGKDRVPAFGFAIFRAKEARPQPSPTRWRHDDDLKCFGVAAIPAPGGYDGPNEMIGSPHILGSMAPEAASGGNRRLRGSAAVVRRAAITETVAVGAGAQIRQDLTMDPKRLDEWETEPAAVVAVYFVPEDVAVQILEGPRRDLVGEREGYLSKTGVQLGTD